MSDIAAPPSAPLAGSASAHNALVYVRDSDSEGVIRQALSDLGVSDVTFKTGGVSAALADLSERSSPRLLIVDVSDLRDPTGPATELIGQCEPSTGVVLIGQSNDIRLYRALREIGAAEYFFKPLVSALVSRTCNAILKDERASALDSGQHAARAGKLILVVGARGGVGATTVAVRTAWRLSEHPPRPVVLVDLDLQFGDAALQLDASPGHALREALERAERVDDLFLERGIIHVSKRLDLLAALEPLDDKITFEEDALLSLLDTLRRRYRYVVVDLQPACAVTLPRVLHLPSVLILVSDAGLASAREVGRLRQMIGPNSPERATMHILNKSGAAGALPLQEFARGAGQTPDVIIPWSREIADAGNMGVKAKPDCAVLDRALGPVFARVAGEKVEPGRSLLSRLFG
ncbi:MAG: AAA family ATPase [Caulobacteraceae bacterium]|nr:AAA family ATPase [Caulobacteraceae bacterium]